MAVPVRAPVRDKRLSPEREPPETKQKEEGAGANAAQAEADTDVPGGEEHGLEFPISAVLYES